MEPVALDEEREARIQDEIVVDCYGPEEQAVGWYYYLDENLHFPFRARCISQRATSPLRVGETVMVEGMAPEAECEHEMFVVARWKRRSLAVPLAQLEGVGMDEETAQAVGDWHYWVARGYEL